jgi:predicted nucleotidyltransferase
MANRDSAVDQRVETLVAVSKRVFAESHQSLRAAVLYGSSLGVAFRSDSDIDLAVLDDAEHRLSWQSQAALMDRLERALQRGVDLRMLRDGSPSYQANVLDHGRLVWEREPGELARYAREALPGIRAARLRAEREWPRALSRLARQ